MLGLVLRGWGYEPWWDQTLRTGEWRPQVAEAIERSAAGIVLVSEHSLTSSIVMDWELPRLLERGPVAPVYVAPCPWRSVPAIAGLQFLGSTNRSLAELNDDRGEMRAAISLIAQQAPAFLGLDRRGEAPDAPVAPIARLGAVAPVDRVGALHGVPGHPRAYFARTSELERLQSLLVAAGSGTIGLASPGAVALAGVGGVGKTVLAAAAVRDDHVRRSFPDGVFWVALGQRPDLVGVQSSLAGLIGIESGFRTVEEGRQVLTEALADRRVLLVLDDVWSAADAEALLVVGAAGRALLTTRYPLVLQRLGATRLDVDRLSPAEGRRFLARMTGEAEPLAAEVDALVEAVGGIMLPLALVGATIRHGTTWLAALEAVRAASSVFHDETFANQFKAMEIALDALDEDDRRRYEELAVFPEDVAIPSVTVERLWRQTAGIDARAADHLLTQLAERSLLAYEDGVRFHDLQRDFLQVTTSDAALAHRRLLDAHRDELADRERWSTLPDDEPYLWDHLVWHLVGAGDAVELEGLLTDPAWLVRRYHLGGAHAPEGDLSSALEALPGHRAGALILKRLQQVSHLLALVLTQSDRALTLANHMSDVLRVDRLAALVPPVRLVASRPLSEFSDALERVFTGHEDTVDSVAWSPDGHCIASGGDHTVRVWDPVGRIEPVVIDTGHKSDVGPVAWSPDGHRLAFAGYYGLIGIWHRMETAGRFQAFESAARGVKAMAWSPDGRRLATGGHDGMVQLWDPDAPGRPPLLLGRHANIVSAVAWSADSRRVASTGWEGVVFVWSADGASLPLHRFGGYPRTSRALAWSPDGHRLAWGAENDVWMWNAEDEASSPVLVLGGRWVASLAWSPDSARLAVGSDEAVLIVEPDVVEAPVLELVGHVASVPTVAWSPDGHRLASGGVDGTVRVWSPTARGAVARPRGFTVGLSWSPDGRRVAVGGDETVRIWASEGSDAPIAEFGGDWIDVKAVAWSPDGRLLASGHQNALCLWDPDDVHEPIAVAVGLGKGVESLAWSPDGRWLASGGFDGTLHVWERDAVDLPGLELPRHRAAVVGLAWSPDARRLASTAVHDGVRVWAVSEGKAALTAELAPCSSFVQAMNWSPDGRRLMAVEWDGVIATCDVDASDFFVELARHPSDSRSMACSPDARRLATGGDDGTVRLWDSRTGAPLCALGLGSAVLTLAWYDTRLAFGSEATWSVVAMDE